ncbi:MAG: hypothetical protein M9962_05350 [Oligoflexia bacterium]|nr:hypothetical protein [Oligoflexia bacterium]
MGKLALFFCIFFCFKAVAAPTANEKDRMASAYEAFSKGAYTQAIDIADGIQSADKEMQSTVALFVASAYAKLQTFDKAEPYYERAIKLGNKSPNIFYDYGQALFATQKIREAEEQFKKSIVQKYKMGASAYYIGYCRQLLEDFAGARDYYNRIQKLSTDPDSVKQPALMQMAEIEYEIAGELKNKDEKRTYLKEKVLPLYKKVRDFASGTPAHEQAVTKITQVEGEISQHAERMRNGVPIPLQPYTLKISNEFGYDSNVITQADEALVQVSNKNSFYLKPMLLAKYQFNFAKAVSLTPELTTFMQYYVRRDAPRVYQNDNISFTAALRSKFEHWSKKQPATALVELEWNLMLRDYEQQHKFPYYSRYWNLVIGERVKWFNTGTTTLKLSLKLLENYNPDRNSYSPTISFQQNIKVADKWDWSNTLSFDYLHARNDVNDEKNYKYKQSMAMTDLWKKITFTPSLTLNLKDTMKQKGSRGNEFLVNPSLNFSKDLFKNFSGDLEYAFSKNYSKAKDTYKYTKHELKFTTAYSF